MVRITVADMVTANVTTTINVNFTVTVAITVTVTDTLSLMSHVPIHLHEWIRFHLQSQSPLWSQLGSHVGVIAVRVTGRGHCS